MKALLISWLIAAIAVTASPASPFTRTQDTPSSAARIDIFPSSAATGPSIAKFVSSEYGLDGPQLSSVNSSVFDWWYFDVVSTDLKSSLVVIFYTALPSAFPLLSPSDDVTLVGLRFGFPNGTVAKVNINASEAVVTTVEDGSSGCFEGTGASWTGAPDLSSYLVTIDSPANGIVGTFFLESVAPAHYPCGPVGPGQNMMVGPNIGWSNAMPDANGVVNLTVGGSQLAFSGVAYHDQVKKLAHSHYHSH